MATAKQRAAARKNIKKAQAARRKNAKGHTKTTRKAEKRSGKRGKGKASAKQRAAARKNIKKAQAANRRKGGGKTKRKSPRKAAKRASVKRPRKAKAKSGGKRKGGGKRRSGRKGGKRGKRKGGRRAAHRHTSSVHTTRTEIVKMPGHTTKVAILPIQSAARRSSKRRTKRKGGKRKSGKRGKRKGGSRARETGYAMENPLSGMEIFVGGLTGLLGFGVADVLDRYLATHALGGTTGAYTDTPPTTGTYAGLYNATAVIAPMGLLRWGVGLGLTAVPLVAARWVKAPVGRSALQFFGFGVGFRVVGKGLQDLFAYMFKSTSFGLRLYDAEVRAYYLKKGDSASTAALPLAGLGEPPELTCGKCANCVTGVGACCGSRNGDMQGQPQGQPPPPPPPPPQTQPPQQANPPTPAPSWPQRTQAPIIPNPRITNPPGFRTGTFAGVPDEQPRRSKYAWGSPLN